MTNPLHKVIENHQFLQNKDRRKHIFDNLECGIAAFYDVPWHEAFVAEGAADPQASSNRVAEAVRFLLRWKEALKTYKEAPPKLIIPAPPFGTMVTAVATGETAVFVREGDQGLWTIVLPDGAQAAVLPETVIIHPPGDS